MKSSRVFTEEDYAYIGRFMADAYETAMRRLRKRGPRKPDANQLAHSIVAKAEKITRQGPPPQKLRVLPSPKFPKRAR